jgi:hypothetical protein
MAMRSTCSWKRGRRGCARGRAERGSMLIDGLQAVAAVEVGVHHVADDGTGADDGDLDDDVVEALAGACGAGWPSGRGFRSGRRRWCRRAASWRRWRGRLWGWCARSTGRPRSRHSSRVSCMHGHHAEAEEVDLDDAEVLAVVLVPLDDAAAGHGGGLQGHDGVEPALADDHAAGVLAEVAGQAAHESTAGAEARVGAGRPRGGARRLVLEAPCGSPPAAEASEKRSSVFGEVEDLAHLAHGARRGR